MLPQSPTRCLCSSRDSMPRWADQSHQSQEKCRLHPRGDTMLPLSRSSVKETFPSYLASLCISFTTKDKKVYVRCLLREPPACLLPLRSDTVFLLFLLVEAAAHCGWEPGVRLLRFKAWLYHGLVTLDKLPEPLLLLLSSGDRDTGNLRRYFQKILGDTSFAISSSFFAF